MTQSRALSPLVIIGGGEDTEGPVVILREFVRLAGGPDHARIVVMTAASEQPDAQDDKYRAAFGRIGVADFRVLVTDNRRDAESAGAVRVAGRATGVFFTGGDQKRMISLLRGSKLERELRRRYAAGLVIAGTSAGASVMSDVMLDEGDSAECPRRGMVQLGTGLGFLPGVIIDQHFSQRGRLGRLLAAVARRPGYLGVGLGEDTAMVVEGDRFGVVGRGVATVLDGSRLVGDVGDEVEEGVALTLSNVVLHAIGPGGRFDLARRELVPAGE